MQTKVMAGSPRLMKEMNTSLVLELIRRHEPISRSELANKAKLALPTIMRLVEYLLDENLVVEVGKGDSSGGRRPILLKINPQSRYFIGVDVKRKLTVILTDLKGKRLCRAEELTDTTGGPEKIIDQISKMIFSVLTSTGISAEKVAGIGLGTPGMNFKSGSLISTSVFHGWHHVDIQTILKKKFSLPVVVDNVAKAGALGELWFGKGKNYKNFIYVFADFGVGSGVVINGDLYRGVHGDAGEFGHTVVQAVGGRQCYCGNVGCLEMYTSIPCLVEKANWILCEREERIQSIRSFHDIVKVAATGDRQLIEIFEEAGRIMGIGLANLINLYNPEAIIMGGEISCNCPWYVAQAREWAYPRVFSRKAQKTRIHVTGVSEDAGSLGAVALVMNNLTAF